jgi:hypothetical protein
LVRFLLRAQPLGAYSTLITSFLPGLGLVEALVLKYAANATDSEIAIFAGARNPSKSEGLTTLQRKYPNKIFPVTHVAEDEKSTEEVVKIVKDKFGYADVVIGNAGKYIHVAMTSLRFISSAPSAGLLSCRAKMSLPTHYFKL